jgi:transcriptional regulator with XRE-family HTH domain
VSTVEDAVYQRLNFIVNTFEGGNQAEFARRIGVRSGVVGDMFGKRRNKPSFDVLGKIALAYPQLRVEWLLTGEGEMLKESEVPDKYSVEYMVDLFLRPNPNEHISAPSKEEITERPDPEPDWQALRDEVRLEKIFAESADARQNDQRMQELIREAYLIATPDILRRVSRGLYTSPYIIDWNFQPNASSAWSIIRSIPIGLYPKYPFLHYFLDFADPYRRIVVFVEEKDMPWKVEDITYQDRLLIIHGWKVFRIPYKVVWIYESDLLPPHLIDVYDVGAESKEQLIERKTWDAELSKKTIDGFFRWLKKNHFQKETLTSIAFREQDPADWDDSGDSSGENE